MSAPTRSGIHPDSKEWAAGFEQGKKLARNGMLPQDHEQMSSRDPRHRGIVAGWRLNNGQRATPLHDPFTDDIWGAAPEPSALVQ